MYQHYFVDPSSLDFHHNFHKYLAAGTAYNHFDFGIDFDIDFDTDFGFDTDYKSLDHCLTNFLAAVDSLDRLMDTCF